MNTPTDDGVFENPYQQIFLNAWPHLKPWQKGILLARAVYYLYYAKIFCILKKWGR